MDCSMDWETFPTDPETHDPDHDQSETILRGVSADPGFSLSQSSSLWMPYEASNSQPQYGSNNGFQLQGNLDEFSNIYSAGGAGPNVPRPVPAAVFARWAQPTPPQLPTSLIQPPTPQNTTRLGQNSFQEFRALGAPVTNAPSRWPTADTGQVLFPSDSNTYHQPSEQIILSSTTNPSIPNAFSQSPYEIISALQRANREKDHTIEYLDNTNKYLSRELKQLRDGNVDGQNQGERRRSPLPSKTSDPRSAKNGNAGAVSKRKPFDAPSRAQTAATRDLGACIRCRRIKKRISIFRTGNSENDTWTIRDEVFALTELKTFLSHRKAQTVYLTHDWGTPLRVAVREYHPLRGDETSYKWKAKDGTERETPTPYYAIANPDETKIALEEYITDNLDNYKKELLDPENYIVWESFDMASGRAWDGELDQIVIKHILQPLRKEVLQMLQTKIEKFHNRDWFEIFAVIFILLNTIEKAIAHDHEFATMYGHVVELTFPPKSTRGRRFEDYQLIDSYFHAAQALIAHFRDALHGHLPFISGRTNYSTAVKMAELSPEENHFLHELRDYLNDAGRRMYSFQADGLFGANYYRKRNGGFEEEPFV
ncbi:MAG: hypothetical protein Q9160_000634 [Pyrenula sp. 1 TL-2023]